MVFRLFYYLIFPKLDISFGYCCRSLPLVVSWTTETESLASRRNILGVDCGRRSDRPIAVVCPICFEGSTQPLDLFVVDDDGGGIHLLGYPLDTSVAFQLAFRLDHTYRYVTCVLVEHTDQLLYVRSIGRFLHQHFVQQLVEPRQLAPQRFVLGLHHQFSHFEG